MRKQVCARRAVASHPGAPRARRTLPARLASLALALAVLGLFAAPRQGHGQAEPGDGSALTVYLMTMGPGDAVWERFGHNAIWIHDAERGTDIAYDYGRFSFDQENFLLRFVRGYLYYAMGSAYADWLVSAYAAQDRSVLVQELNLTPAQRAFVRDYLEWHDTDARRHYRYDYYRDNCSTRLRDIIDRATGGAVRRQLEGTATGTTYRDHTQRLTADDPLLSTGLLLALGRAGDQEISAWEEGFIPMRLGERLRSVEIEGTDGSPLPLVRSERVLFAADRAPAPAAPPARTGAYLLLGLAIGAGAALLGARMPGSPLARRGFVALAGGWEILAGITGTIITSLWLLTEHEFTYANENVLQANPLSLGLAVLILASAGGGARRRRAAAITALAVAALALAGFLLQALPGFFQRNGEIIALMLPAHAGVAAGLWLAATPRGPAGGRWLARRTGRNILNRRPSKPTPPEED